MKLDQIYDIYVKEIREDFQFNHRRLGKGMENGKSVFARAREKIMTLEKEVNIVPGDRFQLDTNDDANVSLGTS